MVEILIDIGADISGVCVCEGLVTPVEVETKGAHNADRVESPKRSTKASAGTRSREKWCVSVSFDDGQMYQKWRERIQKSTCKVAIAIDYNNKQSRYKSTSGTNKQKMRLW